MPCCLAVGNNTHHEQESTKEARAETWNLPSTRGLWIVSFGIAEVHMDKNMRTVEDGTYPIPHELVRNVMRRSRDVLSIEAETFSLLLEVARSGNRR